MAKKITLTYLIIGSLWIIGSDLLYGGWFGQPLLRGSDAVWMNMAKGLVFVSITGLILYVYLRRHFQMRQDADTQFRHLFEDHPQPMLVCAENGLIEAANPAACTLYEYATTDMAGLRYEQLFSGYAHDRFAQSHWGEVQEHKSKSGKKLSLRVHFSKTNFHGRQSWLVQLIDIAQESLMRQQNESLNKLIYQNERYLFSLIDAQTTYLIRIGTEGRFLFRNRAFLSLFGQSAGYQQPDNLFKMLQQGEEKTLKALLQKCKDKPGKTFSLLLPMQLLESVNRTVEWEFIGISKIDGTVDEIQAVGKDMTDKLQYLEQLSAYKEQLEGIMRTINDVVWSVDAQTLQIRYLNPASSKIYGYKPDDFYLDANLWPSLVHPDDREKMKQHIQNVKTNGSGEIEYRIIRSDGQVRTLSDHSVVVKDEKGKPRTINGIASDITELRKSQQEARTYNDRINYLLNSMNDGFFAVDTHNRLLTVNRSLETLLAKSWDAKSTDFNSYFGPMAELLLPWIAAVRAENKHQKQLHFDNIHKNWLHFHFYPIPDGVAAFVEDITHTRALEERLLSEQRNLAGLINNTDDQIWSVDTQLRLITGNESFKQRFEMLFGFRPNTGQHVLLNNQPPEHYKSWEENYLRALSGEQFVYTQKREIGDRDFYNEISFYPIRDENGQVMAIGCFGKDVTERTEKDIKIQLQNQQLLEIAWIESHKLRAPLANIMGINELLQIATSTSEIEALQERLDQSCKELDTIIREVVKKAGNLHSKTSQQSEKSV